MAYISDRNHDVFISYAHDDNQYEWVKDLALMLEGELRRQLKLIEKSDNISVEVWKDSNLPQQGNLRERLEKEIRESAIFLIIMSESYLLSNWCMKEGIMFANSLKGKSHLKIFIIEKEETEKDKWPKFLKTEEGDPLLSTPFYEKKDVGQKKTIDMKTEQGSPNPRAGTKIEKFCEELSTKLYDFKHHPEISTNDKAKKVFLAISPEGKAHKHRAKLSKLMADWDDIRIFPSPKPKTSKEIEDSLDKQLPQCDLFVQILDDVAGLYITNWPSGLVRHQFDEAKKNKKKILNWLVPDLDIEALEEGDLKQFLCGLNPMKGDNGTVFSGTLDELVKKLHEILDTIDRTTPHRIPGTCFITIKHDIDDEDYANEIIKAIENSESNMSINPIYATINIKPDDLDYFARASLGIVIVWGDVDRSWILKEIDMFNQVAKEGKKIGAIAICGDPQKPKIGGKNIEYLNLSSKVNDSNIKAEINRYVKKLQEIMLAQCVKHA